MGRMRFVVLALAALLVAAAVAFAQDPARSRSPLRPRRRRRRPPPDETPAPTATPGRRPASRPTSPRSRGASPRRSASPRRKGRLEERRAAARARRGLLHLGPDPQRDPEPRVAPLGHRPADPHRAAASCTSSAPSATAPSASGSWTSRARRAARSGANYGGLGHASHQNGLDVDILYPRKDGTETRPIKPSQVDRELAQDLVDRFVAAGAVKVFVGPRLNLKGPKKVVVPLIYHDDHLHVRIR